MLKKIVLALFISTISLSFGQGMFNMFSSNDETSKKWQIGIGASAVSFSPDDIAYVGGEKSIQIPRINISNQFSSEFAMDAAFSITGFSFKDNISYFAFDLSGRYFMLTSQDAFDPYIFIGASIVNFKDIYSPTINMGLGATFWASRDLGFNIQAQYKSGIDKQVMPAHPMLNVGVILGFKNEKKINMSRCSFSR